MAVAIEVIVSGRPWRAVAGNDDTNQIIFLFHFSSVIKVSFNGLKSTPQNFNYLKKIGKILRGAVGVLSGCCEVLLGAVRCWGCCEVLLRCWIEIPENTSSLRPKK